MATRDIVEAFVAAWNHPDERERRNLVGKCWADDAVYSDPTVDVSGRDGLLEVISRFRSQMPGASVSAVTDIDEHHGHLRFGWKVTGSGQPLEGIDVGLLDESGLLLSIIGFWGSTPSSA